MFDIQKFIEVPNTPIREEVLSHQFADELCLSIADDYGYAEVVWYALNGKRVVEGSYGDPKLVGIYNWGGYMSYFKHVALHEYDLTDKGVSQACYDEIKAELGDAWVHLTEEQLRVLADHEREKFKDWMRPLFA